MRLAELDPEVYVRRDEQVSSVCPDNWLGVIHKDLAYSLSYSSVIVDMFKLGKTHDQTE